MGKQSAPLVERKKPSMIKRVAAYAAAAVFAFSPMLEQPAHADKTASSQPSANYMINGTRLQISDGKESPWVYAISRQADVIPTIRINGPCVLRVRFYPAVNMERFDAEPEVQSTLRYSLAKGDEKAEPKAHDVMVKKSGFTSTIVDTRLAIAMPVMKSVFVPKGDYVFSALSPNGFLELVSVELIVDKPPAPKPKAKPKIVVKAKPAPLPEKKKHAEFSRFEFSGERVWLHAIGPQENSGDLNLVEALVNIPIGNLLALNTGVSLSSFGLVQESVAAKTGLRSLSAAPAIGIALNKGKHSAFARALAGYRLMRRHIDSKEGSDVENTHTYELGGQAGYSYRHAVEFMVSGSNNPFNPLSARIHGSLPWGWVKGAHPSVELDVLWLHSLSAYDESGRVGGVRLDVKNVFAHATGSVPIWRIGPVVPALLVAGDMNASEKGFHHADFLLGADVSVELHNFMIEAGGAVSPLSSAPFFRLKVLYK